MEEYISRKVCVITGGGSGMGLASAKLMGRDHYLILTGRTQKKLEEALRELSSLGIQGEAFACDVSNQAAVEALAARAAQAGQVRAVIHAAGMSPHMGTAREIMEANALGTIHVNEAFYPVMAEGGSLIDVASMSGHLLPGLVIPTKHYPLSRKDRGAFLDKMLGRVNLFPKKLRASVAYGISKHFVIWYAKTDAAKFGKKSIRVISVSPGSFETPMGALEEEGVANYLRHCALPRHGRVEEIANLLAFCAGDKAGYLTGCDILCDGGCVASGVNPLKMAH